MQSNAYFLAKFRFDTAENEPAKNLQNFRPKLSSPLPRGATRTLGKRRVLATAGARTQDSANVEYGAV